MLLIAILRAALGLAIVGVAIAGLIGSFMTEGVGCLGSAILFVFFLIFVILVNVVDEAEIEAFLGMDTWDYMVVILVAMVGGFLLSSTHIAGIGTSLALGFTGLVISGLLSEAELSALSQGVMDVGIVVMLPIVLPMVIVIVAVGLAFRRL